MRVENTSFAEVEQLESHYDPPSIKWWHYASYASIMFLLMYLSNIEVAFANELLYRKAPQSPVPAAWLKGEIAQTDELSVVKAWTEEAGADSAMEDWLGNPVEETAVAADIESQSLDEFKSHVQTFTISAYYSPVPGQSRYVTGSYAGDIRLNGGGVHGADGTPVYPGMIAAPPSFAFGTKMYIPGIGTVAVHDRGGAIKGSRLDVWMGYGDKGLQRALKWGKRTLDVTVYGVNDAIKENIELDDYDPGERGSVAEQSSGSTQTVTPAPVQTVLFSRTLTMGSQGDDVAKLQKLLTEMNLYEGEISAVFDKATHEAVAKFQISKNIIDTSNSYGAGYVGPRTSSLLASAAGTMETAHAKENTIETDGSFINDLQPGDSGEAVRKLQEELQRVHLFGIEPTGYYGELTQHAVFKFQQINKLAGDDESPGAGIFGPLTRSRMNEIVAARSKLEELMQ